MSIQSTEPYVGRLVCDGEGNLLADEGEFKGSGVFYDVDSNSYLFVDEDGFSHNDVHHERFAVIKGTDETDPHHTGPTPDDPHYDATAPNNTNVRFVKKSKQGKQSGHTETYTNV